MKTNHRSNSCLRFACFARALALAFSLLNPSSGTAQTQTYPCETVMQFGTGMSNGGSKLRDGSVDPNFEGASINFPVRAEAFVPTNVPTAWLADASSPDSQWIAPVLNPSTAAAGTYVYRLRFTTPCAGGTATGRYAASDRGVLRLNGGAISFSTPASGTGAWTTFSFNSLPAGANTLDFYVTNTPPAVDRGRSLRRRLL